MPDTRPTVAIITGASAGIGAATAKAFLDRGDTVIAIARRPSPHEGAISISTDLTSGESIDALAQKVKPYIGNKARICLVHNAAKMNKDKVDACPDEDLRAVLETNIIGINHLNRALLPHMDEGSSIVYVGSTLAEKAVPGSFSYVISKHAQLGMMRATCQDLMGSGIHTAMVCPGFTDTEMLRTHLGDNTEVINSIGAMNSFSRLVQPEEIASGIVFCHNNPAINGSVFHLNLGQKES
jgi:3-oxoacyl-[acyl-carrier protein] reductase